MPQTTPSTAALVPQKPEELAPVVAAEGTSWLRWAIGLGVGALFTWLSARSWPLGDLFGGTLAVERFQGDLAILLRKGGSVRWSVDLWALGAYAGILSVIHWLRVLRWKPLLAPYADVPVPVLNRGGAVGFMAVFLLPLRLGELARPLMLARSTAVPFGAGLGTIALERVLDGLITTLVLYAVLIQVHPDTLARSPEVARGAWIALAVFSTALLGLTATLLQRERTLGLTRKLLGLVSPLLAEKIIGLLTAFVDGLKVLKSPWALAEFVGMSVTYWGINGVGVWLVARGCGLDIPVVAAYAMMCCLVVGMMIPNPPGSVGIFWTFLLLPASLYGIDPNMPRTIIFALVLWVAQTVQVTVFGIWGWWADARELKRD